MQTSVTSSTALTSSDTPFHIAFCIDNRFFMPMGATIASIIANNPEQYFVFHVLTFEISDDNQQRLKQFDNNSHVKTQVHLIDLNDFSQFSHYVKGSPYSLSIFVRLVIADVLKEITDKVLYLDADILCVGQLDEMIALDVKNTIAAVSPDIQGIQARQIKALNLKHPLYFNAGMMLINIGKWIDHNMTTKTLSILADKSLQLSFNDQDALNMALDGHDLFISSRWNFLYGLFPKVMENRTEMELKPDTVFIHFAGGLKPWSNWLPHNSVNLFRQYHSLSPWGNVPLDKYPRGTKEIRMYSRILLKQKKYLSGIKWFFIYLYKHGAR